MTINERIGLILKDKNLTANEFAAQLEVRSSNISHIITGRNKPSFDFLEKLTSVYPDINTLWLIKGDGEMYVSDGKEEVAESVKEEVKPEVVVNSLNRETMVSMQTNLFGELEELERPIPKIKKIVIPPKNAHTTYMETEEKTVVKTDHTKRISSIIVYYSNGNFEEFIPKA